MENFNFSSFKKEWLPLINEITEIIKNNQDNTPMEIGDRVIPWDGSSVSDINGNKKFIVLPPFTTTSYWIVASNTEKTEISSSGITYHQDLLIVNHDNIYMRISSRDVKHYNN